MELVLETWKQLSRHSDMAAALDQLMPALRRELGLDSIHIFRLDVPAGKVEIVTGWPTETASSLLPARLQIATVELQRLSEFCRLSRAIQRRPELKNLGLAQFVPDNLGTRDFVVVPLSLGNSQTNDEPPCLGLMSFIAKTGAKFDKKHLAQIKDLIEPFSVALNNQHRLRELRTLREAKEAENQALLLRLHRQSVSDAIVGAESGLTEVMRRVELVAVSDAPVLLLGETGTGKEVIARAIHTRSQRASGPMIRVNCGAIPHELIDSELFGHERGSFTGAVDKRKGWFERADGGTLFLDEIGELPPAAQVRLLRVLQDGTFERVGGQSVLTVDVRIVAATHTDLQEMTGRGAFRSDLWYRISVFPIHLPPLRDRLQDIPELATHFALKAAKRFGLPPALPTPDDLAVLSIYPWPGNVRELASVIERAAILGNGHCLEVAKSLGIGDQPRPIPAPIAGPESTPSPAGSATLDQAAEQHIRSALTTCRGRIEGPFGIARLLGINPHTLRARMRKLGIGWGRYRAK